MRHYKTGRLFDRIRPPHEAARPTVARLGHTTAPVEAGSGCTCKGSIYSVSSRPGRASCEPLLRPMA